MSDEDRLRQRLREQVAQVPVVTDLDDVAVRIGRPGQRRTRSLAAVSVLALAVAAVAGFSAGRVGRGSSRPFVATAASGPGDGVVDTGSGPAAPDTGPGSWHRVFLRTTADGIAMRVYSSQNVEAQPVDLCPLTAAACFKQAAAGPPVTLVDAELSTDAAVTSGGASFATEPVSHIGEVAAGRFGVIEGAPAEWVVVQAGSDVARVRVTFGDAGADEMQPVQGIALLARLAGGPTATVEALDGQGHVLDHRTVSTATSSPPTTLPATTTSPPTLPAPGPIQPSDPANARAGVTSAFAGAFDGSATDATRTRSIEGGSALVTVFDQLRHGPVAASVLEARTVIDGIVFLSATGAAVEFHSRLGSQGTSGPYFGDAILTPTGWQVSRAAYCRIVIAAGVHCP